MKCQSCNADIPPAWVHAIQLNICPGCGKAIMNEDMQELLKGLTEAIEKMPDDAQGIAGWLLSNYRMEKVGDGEPTGFHRPKKASKKQSQQQEEDESTPKGPLAGLTDFYKRATEGKLPPSKEAILNKTDNSPITEEMIAAAEQAEGVSRPMIGSSSGPTNDLPISVEQMVAAARHNVNKNPAIEQMIIAANKEQVAYKQQAATEAVTSGGTPRKGGFVRSG